MDGSQVLQGGVALGLGADVLDGDGIKDDVGNGIAGLVDHVGPAVLADLDGGYDIVQEGLGGNEIHHAHDGGAVNPVFVQGGCHHDGQFPGDFADQGLRYIDIALHGLLDIFPVGIVLSVENADAVHADEVPALEIVHGAALIDDGLFLLRRCLRIGELGDAAGIHGYIPVSGQLLFHAPCRQDRRFAHHVIHSGKDAAVAGNDAGNARS